MLPGINWILSKYFLITRSKINLGQWPSDNNIIELRWQQQYVLYLLPNYNVNVNYDAMHNCVRGIIEQKLWTTLPVSQCAYGDSNLWPRFDITIKNRASISFCIWRLYIFSSWYRYCFVYILRYCIQSVTLY